MSSTSTSATATLVPAPDKPVQSTNKSFLVPDIILCGLYATFLSAAAPVIALVAVSLGAYKTAMDTVCSWFKC